MPTDMLHIIIVAFSVLILLFLFLIFPAARKHPDLELIRGKYIAHRGLHDISKGVPENSLAAFDAAAKNGFPIEIDIHLTLDGEVVVFHDDDTLRACSKDFSVERLTLAQLKELKLFGTDENIPTLSECLETVSGRVPLLIEYKCLSGDGSALCVAADKILSSYSGRYFVQSFYPPVLLWFKRNKKNICRGQLSCRFKSSSAVKKMLYMLIFNFMSRPDFISYCHESRSSFCFKLCRALGAFPVGWTFESQVEVDEAKKDFETYIFEGFLPIEYDK